MSIFKKAPAWFCKLLLFETHTDQSFQYLLNSIIKQWTYLYWSRVSWSLWVFIHFYWVSDMVQASTSGTNGTTSTYPKKDWNFSLMSYNVLADKLVSRPPPCTFLRWCLNPWKYQQVLAARANPHIGPQEFQKEGRRVRCHGFACFELEDNIILLHEMLIK